MFTIEETQPQHTASSSGDLNGRPRVVERARAVRRAARRDAPPRRPTGIEPRERSISPRLARWCTEYDER